MRAPEIAGYFTLLGDSLASVTGTSDLEWTFKLVNFAEANAFALPGGFVYDTRGLVERTVMMDQRAGVLTHEISHVTRRHAVKQYGGGAARQPRRLARLRPHRRL